MLIIKPFNPVFWGLFLCLFLFYRILVHLLMDKNAETRKKAVFSLYVGTCLIYVFYKIVILFFDPAYSQICLDGGKGVTSIWKELPLNPCNICLLMILLGLKTNKRPLISMCYHISVFGAFFALYSPDIGFSGYSLLTPRVLGFYLTHLMIFLMPFFLYSLDVYRPEYQDIPKAMAIFFALGLLAHLVNIVFRVTGIEVHSNYFFTFQPVSLLKFFYDLLPVPGLYEIPGGIVIIGLYMTLMTALSKALEKLTKQR